MQGLSNLRELSAGSTFISAVAPDAFASLSQIEVLDLSFGRLSALPDGAFAALPRLRKLNLANNQLTQLSDGAAPFAALTQLEVLDLSNNQLTFLGDQWLTALGALRTLRLGGNRLRTLPTNASALRGIFLLDVAGNDLLRLGDGWEALPALRIANVSGNELAGAVARAQWPALEVLDVSRNGLSAFPWMLLERAASLEVLYAADNAIALDVVDCVPGRSPLPQLRLLDLSRNALVDSDALAALRCLQPLRGLQDLRLSGNGLVRTLFPFAYTSDELPLPFPALQALDLSHARIAGFMYTEDWVALSPRLAVVDLTGNRDLIWGFTQNEPLVTRPTRARCRWTTVTRQAPRA